MALFEPSALRDYRNDSQIQDATRGFKMLTRSEFSNWYTPIARSRSKTVQKISQTTTEMIVELYKYVCQGQIGKEYLKHGIGHVYPYRIQGQIFNKDKFDPYTRELRNKYFDARKDKKFDFLVSVKQDAFDAKNLTQEQKNESIVSFIVTELGECKRKPNTVSVNLICSKPGTTFKGNFLLAATMICVKASKYDQELILELAGKYSNIAGFKSYSRVGFDRDPSLYGGRCFNDISNLPMSVQLDSLNNEEIISYVIAKRPTSKLKEELAKIFYLLPNLSATPSNRKLASKLGRLANYYHEVDVDSEPEEEEYFKVIKESKTKETKKQRLLNKIRALTPQNTPVNITQKELKRKADEQTVGKLYLAKRQLKHVVSAEIPMDIQKAPTSSTPRQSRTSRRSRTPIQSRSSPSKSRSTRKNSPKGKAPPQGNKPERKLSRSISRGRTGRRDD